jgi:hypothetical protein
MQSEQSPATDTEAGSDARPFPLADRQAQKRVAIGLSPRRPTARTELRRPPRTMLARWQQWAITLMVVALIGATLLLVIAKATGAPTGWPQVRTQLEAILFGRSFSAPMEYFGPSPAYTLRLEETFATKTELLAGAQQDGQWATDILPERGVYHFQIWPGRLAWSTLAVDDLTRYWVEGSFTIVDLMPEGYTGFLGRYQDGENFYLFVVDGATRYQVLLWEKGQLTTLQTWIASPVINPAGYENLLALEDDGQALRFYANDQLLFTVIEPQLPWGATGLVGGAGERTMAEITVDWLRLYEPGS